MRIISQRIEPDTKDLARTVRTLQENVNQTLSRVEVDSVLRLTLQVRPEEFPLSSTLATKSPVWGLQMVYLRNLTDDTAGPTNDVFVDWIPEREGVTIRNINGLTPTHLYELRFLAYA